MKSRKIYVFFSVLACGAKVAGSAEGKSNTPILHTLEIRSGKLRAEIGLAGEAALQLLETEECQRVFSDFKDPQGHTLRENLDALNLTAAAYLHTLLFSDGGKYAKRCEDPGLVAVTKRGSQVILICPAQFEKVVLESRRYAGAVIIHEALHTLGLSENPPSPLEITQKVLGRCR